MIEYVDDSYGRPGFRVTSEDSDVYRGTSFTATVDVVKAWNVDDFGAAEVEPYLTCMIKWDGCCHFWFGEPRDDAKSAERDGYLHLCGVEDLKSHALLIEALHRIAFREMGREGEDEARW